MSRQFPEGPNVAVQGRSSYFVLFSIFKRGRDSELILCWRLVDVVDDDHLPGSLCLFELQAELLLQRFENRNAGSGFGGRQG